MAKVIRRSANFSKPEENLLLQLIEHQQPIIDNKHSDTNSNRSKKRAWKMIEIEFNSRSKDFYRSADILKTKYENLKKRAKALRLAEKQSNGNNEADWAQNDLVFEEDTIIKIEADDNNDTETQSSSIVFNVPKQLVEETFSENSEEVYSLQDKNELGELNRQLALEEHSLKLKHLKQLHEVRLEQEVEKLKHLKTMHLLQEQQEELKLELMKKANINLKW